MPKVAVIDSLKAPLAVGTCFDLFFFDKIAVWNRSIFERSLIKVHNERWWNLCSSTRLVIWCWNSSSASSTAQSGISGLSVVHMRLTNLILWKRLWVHIYKIKSIYFKYSPVLFSISACATAMATKEFTFNFSSSESRMRSRPRYMVVPFGSTVLLLFNFTNSSYFFLRLLAVLSIIVSQLLRLTIF